MADLGTRIKEQAHALGFERAGIAPAADADGFPHLRAWLDQGCAGEMGYLERQAEPRRHPASILPDVKSVVMLALNYGPSAAPREREASDTPLGGFALAASAPSLAAPSAAGRIARYARGADYHDVLRGKLNRLLAWVQEEVPGCQGRGVVDTAPLLERDFARRAGLGWFGKNTMLIDKRLGSYLFLAALLLDIELRTDPPHHAAHCGTCTACLDACPTNAFTAPYQLDARRCISYLTIELRGSVPEELRPGMGDWLFGCDICQEVCPWNRKPTPGLDPDLQARYEALDPVELLAMSAATFRQRFRDTPLWRSKRRGLLRNAAIVLGNQGNGDSLPALEAALHDEEPLVREAAAWAIEQIRGRAGE